ncbi:unnamed protein product [Echinostoma caproni]|uniref:CUB domain-containing protein n=1 Tax=Echinostoma caproni TaxID=27848 RepID=A0A183ARR7_9TREM|nr:unnamed protein product [Echinostoma caproni]
MTDVAKGWTVPPTGSQFSAETTCEYVLTGTEGKTYQLQFQSFTVGASADNCDKSYLQISNDAAYSEQPPNKFCGPNPPANVPMSTGHVLYVKLVVGPDSPDQVSFKATVKEEAPIAGDKCGTKALSMTDVAKGWTVPPTGSQFSAETTCEYVLTGTEGKTYQLQFQSFTVGASADNCDKSYLQISNDAAYSEQPPNKFCGPNPPANVPMSTGHVLYVKLVVGPDSPDQVSFKATVKEESSGAGDKCGTKALTMADVAKGWTVPTTGTQFDASTICEYVLTGTEGKTYELVFSNFTVGASADNCDKSYLQISNDAAYSEQTPIKFCGPTPPANVPSSTGHILYVKLVVGADSPEKVTFSAIAKERFTQSDGVSVRVC